MEKKKKEKRSEDTGTSEIFKPEGMWLQRIYCYKGGTSKNNSDRHLFSIFDHPVNGQSLAFIIEPTGHSQMLTVFDPFHFGSYQVKQNAGELSKTEPIPITEEKRKQLIDNLSEKWSQRCRLGMKADFDTAAVVLTRLGAEIPTTRPRRIEEQVAQNGEKKKGGKPASDALLKPLPTSGKRFMVLEHFSEGKSIREAMAEFGMSRSTVLTHLYRLNKDHGVGYDLIGEKAVLTVPA